MTVRELNGRQLAALKQRMVSDEIAESEGRAPTWGELAEADAVVKDEAVFAKYEGTYFSPEDFPG